MPLDCNDPSHPLASEGFPPSSCSAIPVLINSMDAIATYLCSLNLGELEFRVAVTNDPNDFDALFLGVGSDNRLVVDSDGSLWYSALAVGGWTLVSAGYCITNDTLANILALQTAGTLSPGCWYQVNDNVHAEGGDLLMQALDASHLSPSGFYYHAPGDVWFPMEWNTENGDMVYLKDTRWNNVAYGVAAVDEFIWTVNDTLADVPGDWANNTFVNTLSLDFSAITPSEYGVFKNNTFEYSTLTLGGVVFRVINNSVTQNSTLSAVGMSGLTFIENNKLVNSTIDLDTCENMTCSGNVSDRGIINGTIVSDTAGINNVQNNILTGGTSTSSLRFSGCDNVNIGANNIVASAIDVTGTTININNNLVRANTGINLNGGTDIFFGGNTFANAPSFEIANYTAGVFTNNTVENCAFFIIDGIDTTTFDANKFYGNATVDITNIADSTVSNNEFNNLDTCSWNFITNSTLTQNVFDTNSSLTIGDGLNDINAFIANANKVENGSVFSVLDTDGLEISENKVNHSSTLSITAAGAGQITNNQVDSTSSLLVNSTSFTGQVHNNTVAANSFFRFAAHVGTAQYNRLYAADITATKNLGFTCNTNIWFNFTVVLGAGVNTNGTATND